jgi:hypothetical protein
LLTRGTAFVNPFKEDPANDKVRSVRIGGIGAKSLGKLLRVKVVGQDGLSILDALTWIIDAEVSPDLALSAPIPSDSIGAVLIAIE